MVEMKKEKDSNTLDGYFSAVSSLKQHKGLSQRLRFKMLDMEDLRRAKWPEPNYLADLRGIHACKDGVPSTAGPPSAKSKLKAKLRQFSEKRASKRFRPGTGKPGGMAALIGYTGPTLRGKAARRRTGSTSGVGPLHPRVQASQRKLSTSSSSSKTPPRRPPRCLPRRIRKIHPPVRLLKLLPRPAARVPRR